MNESKPFYLNGYIFKEFKETETFGQLKSLLNNLRAGELKPGFEWIQKEKYEGSKDLRPYAYEYDPVFLDILFDQNIPKIIRQVTGVDLTLLHVKLRINMPGNPYSTWHRDTTFYNNKVKGNVPPVVNLHYYPNFDDPPEPQLRIWPKTHRLKTKYKIIDRLIVKLSKGKEIFSDNKKFVILNTGLIHQITPTSYPKGAARLMYSFGRKFQEENLPEQKSLHDLYHKRLQNEQSS